MTQESKSRRTVRERKIERSYTETEVYEDEVEIPGTRCDFCNQWYAEDEEVDFDEFVINPKVVGVPDDYLTFRQLMEYIYSFEVGESQLIYKTGNRMPACSRLIEIGTIEGLIEEMENQVERGGGFRGRLTPENISASMMNNRNRLDAIQGGEIVFKLDIKPEVDGEVQHMCEYCKEAHNDQ